MKVNADIATEIYSTTIHINDIVRVIDSLGELENQENIKVKISLTTKDGVTYSAQSALELLTGKEDFNLTDLVGKEIIKGVQFSNYENFRFYISSDDGRINLSKKVGSTIGVVFEDLITKTLKLRKKSVVSFVRNIPIAVPLLSLFAFISLTKFGYEKYSGLLLFPIIIVLFLSDKIVNSTLIMGNSRDGFWVRKRDDIAINLVFLIAGFLLGAFSTNIMSFFK